MLLLTALQNVSAQIKWDFDENSGTASVLSTSVPANVTASDFSFGNTFGTVTPMVTNTSASNYTGASGNYNATVSANATTPFSTTTNTYFTFTLTPATGYSITMSAIQFGARSLTTGPNAYQIYTSADNFTTSIGGNSLNNNSSWYLKQPTTTLVVGAANTPLVVRVYGYAGVSPVSGTANWRIDDLAVTVSVVAPISLKSFSIGLNNKQPLLSWETVQEINANYFSIQRSSNAKDFFELAKVAASNKIQGSTYQYSDNDKIIGTKYYRLQMVDKDGSYKYSNVLVASEKDNVAITAYPNPTTSNSISIAHAKASSDAVIRVVSMNGTIIFSIKVQEGSVQTNISFANISKGQYIITYDNAGVKSATQFSKQ
jgi:hypothetical protein